MLKLIRNNQKKVLAGAGVLLMITFLAGYGGTGGTGRSGPVEREVGRADGKPVMVSDLTQAHAELAAVNEYARRYDPRQTGGQSASVIDALLGRDVAAAVLRRPELFVLLRREAVAGGVVPNPTQAQQVMDETLGGTAADGTPVEPPSTDSDAYQAVRIGVTDLLLVKDYYNRVSSALKPSRPAVDHALATQAQTIQLTLIPVPAEAFTAQVVPPTPQQLSEQFDRYAAVEAGRPDPITNPFGFGYRSPLRTRLQYVRLTRDNVEKAVIATKNDYDWEVLARKLYYAHPEQFTAAPPTTSPTDVPATPVLQPFDRVRDQAFKAIRDPLVQALQDQVQQFLIATMTRDWQAYKAAVLAHSPASATAVGQPYEARAYLRALTDQAEAQFHVRVNSDQTGDLSAKQVGELPGLSTADAAPASSSATASDSSLPAYVSDRALAAIDPKAPVAAAEVMHPSPVFTEAGGDAVDIVRIAAVLPPVPAANLEAVRPAVEADVRAAAAYDRAKAQADQLAAAAANGTMLAAATAAGRSIVPAQPLSMQDVAVDGLTPPLGDAAPDFLTQAFGLLDRFNPATEPHPAEVIALPTQRRLIVAQLTFVNARWTPANYYQMRIEAAAELRQRQAAAARLGWFNYDAVVLRTSYKPAAQAGV